MFFTRLVLIPALVCSAMTGMAQTLLHFEAEEVIVNKEVVIKDKMRPDLWTYWTTDKDADKKWSGGVVIRSPEVKTDRATPEEGAPVLYVSIPMPESGTWDIRASGINRPIALSRDGGKTWIRQTSPLIAEGIIADGTPFTCCFDDAFAHDKPEHCGATYLDYFSIIPAVPTVNGVKNPDFEAVTTTNADAPPAGWSWWSRDGAGLARPINDAKSGKQAAIITYAGDKDWAFNNDGGIAVSKGQQFTGSVWVKILSAKSATAITLQAVGSRDKKVVKHGYASAKASDSNDWQLLTTTFTIGDDIDHLRLRIIGVGDTDIVVDACNLEPAN